MKPTRILFVDDHSLFRESVVRLLGREPDFQIVAQCGTIKEAERILAETPVDLALLDYDLGTEVGTALLASLRRLQPTARIVMVTAGMGSRAVVDTIEAGVAGIVLKHSDPDRLIEAIRRVATGETWWDNGILEQMTGRPAPNGTPAPTRSVTDRQRQILLLILDGLTNKEIAFQLKSSESSVKASIQELFMKAGVRTRSQLVRIALEHHAADWLRRD